MENQMSALAECEDCHKRFAINKDNVIQREFESNGQSILLTYYDCPDCGRRHFVQIDNKESGYKLQACKTQMTNLMVLRRKGKNTRKQSEKFKRTRQDLSDYRTKLMKEFTGKTCYDKESDSEFVLRFSV